MLIVGYRRKNLALKGSWGCLAIEKSIATQDRALGHIMGPKLQIPFNVYGIIAITRQSISALLPLSLCYT